MYVLYITKYTTNSQNCLEKDLVIQYLDLNNSVFSKIIQNKRK